MDEQILPYLQQSEYRRKYCTTQRNHPPALKPVELIPESYEPFGRQRVKRYDEPNTAAQLYHLERWGYWYE